MAEEPLRTYALEKIAEVYNLPKTNAKVKNTEISIHNWVISQTKPDEASWENRYFRGRYKQRLLSVLFNMKKNPALVEAIKTKEVNPADIGGMAPEHMWPDGPYAKTEVELREKETQKELARLKFEAGYEGILTCPKCKSKKTSYYQMQTRSADEVRFTFTFSLLFDSKLTLQQPATNFCSCICGHRWRFC